MLDLNALAGDPDLDFPPPPLPAPLAEPLALLGYEECRAAGASWAHSMQALVVGAKQHHTSHIRIRDVPLRLALFGAEHDDLDHEGPTPVPESVEEQQALATPLLRYAAARREGRSHEDAMLHAGGPMIGYRTSRGWSVLWTGVGFINVEDADDWAALGLRLIPADACDAHLLPHVRVVLRGRTEASRKHQDVLYVVPASIQ